MTTRRPVSQGPRAAGEASPLNVMAAFDDMQSARAAIEALGTAGVIDGERITLTGPAANDAANRTESHKAETKLLGRIVSRAAAVSAAAATLGAGVGLLVGPAVLSALDADTSAANIALCIALGAFMGSIVGALIGFVSSLQPSQPWALTFEESSPGPVFVGVHSEHENEVSRAESILRQHSTRVRRLDHSDTVG